MFWTIEDADLAIIGKDGVFVGGRFVMAIDPYSASFTAQQRYYITDHLGSTRVVLNNAGTDNEVTTE